MSSEIGLMQHLETSAVGPQLDLATGQHIAATNAFGENYGAPLSPNSLSAAGTLNGFAPNSTNAALLQAHAAPQTAAGHSGAAAQPHVIDYTTEFPALAQQHAQAGHAATESTPSAWGAKTIAPTSKRVLTQVTQVFHLPAEERRYLQDPPFGERSNEQMDCNDIMERTGAHIELCESRDHSLTIVVSGKRQLVEDARIQIVKRLQTQAQRDLSIPKDHHRVIIGKEGKKLQDLEKATACRIMIPSRDNPSDVIRISGPREGIDAAVHEIQKISDEQSKLAQERLNIPKIFYPWIRGPHNEVVDKIIERTGARINIPPSMAVSDTIVITGEKEGVYSAAKEIRKIYEEKLATCQTVSIQVAPSQHKYVAGPGRSGITEILRETGVSVELPPEDSNSSTITLRGDSTKLGSALALVYAKASSVIRDAVPCPGWLHRFIIGPNGQNIKRIVTNPAAVAVDFSEENGGVISIEGSPNEVKQAKGALAELSAQLQKELSFDILHINAAVHRHIIGKAGVNINRIKEETGVLVNIPEESSKSDQVRLEGKKEMVVKAKEMIMDIVSRVENEKSRDIIIDQRFHGQIIGTKGEAVREMRDKFPGVNVSFPEQGRKSDIVTLRGPKEEVDKCYRHLQVLAKDLAEANYQVKVPIFKDFHKVIIGKGGQNIKKIREETDTRIDLPAEGSETDVITITGKKTNVEKAKDMLTKIQNELASIVTVEVSVPKKVHSQLLQKSGRLIHSIQEDCGGVHIKFPPENSAVDKISIRGPKDDVEKAKKMLTGLAKDKELASFTLEVKAKPEQFRFLIGRGGATIKKLREHHAHVRFLFPRPQDEDQETIHLVGKKDEVENAQKALETIVSDLNKIIELHVEIDPKWHRHFVARRAAELREIEEQFGGVNVSFPRQGSNSKQVTLKGAKDCVEGAKKRMLEIVDDLESQVTVRAVIPQQHHRALLGNRGADIQDICQNCNVQIKFPGRSDQPPRGRQTSNTEDHSPGPQLANGDVHQQPEANGGGAEATDIHDVVIITGRADKCQQAKERLEALIPVTETLNVPFDFHRFLIGSKGDGVRTLMRDFKVNIAIPPKDLHQEEIAVSGPRDAVRDAIAEIMRRVEGYEEEARQKGLKSFAVYVDVPIEHHSKIIGPKGFNINKLRKAFDVVISVPDPNHQPENEHPETIVIKGFEDKAKACKEEIERQLQSILSTVSQHMTLDPRVHSRILGAKGKNVRKIMDDFGVDIRFPRQSDPDQNVIVVSGTNEDAIFDCIDHLRILEEEHLQDYVDKNQYRHPAFADDSPQPKEKPTEFVVKNAPWEKSGAPPDVANMEDFPTMGGDAKTSEANNNNNNDAKNVSSPRTPVSAPSGAWGMRR